MKLPAIVAAIAVVAVPIAVQGAQAPTKANPASKRICTVDGQIGSRLGGVRRCRTQEEREAEKQETKQVVDRVQSMKPTTCPPMC